jgi:hypothetical protein
MNRLADLEFVVAQGVLRNGEKARGPAAMTEPNTSSYRIPRKPYHETPMGRGFIYKTLF